MFFCISGYLASRSYLNYVKGREVGLVGFTEKGGEGDGVAHEACLPECSPQDIKQKQSSSPDPSGSWLSKWTSSFFHRPIRLLLLFALSMVPPFISTKFGLCSSLIPQAHSLLPLDRAHGFGLDKTDNSIVLPVRMASNGMQYMYVCGVLKQYEVMMKCKDCIQGALRKQSTMKRKKRRWVKS